VIGGCGVSATGGGAELFEAAPSLDAGTITVQIGGASHTLTRSAGEAGDVYGAVRKLSAQYMGLIV
jgi:hypothetical protein